MKTADKYLLSQYLKPFFIVSTTFLGLFLFVDSAEKSRHFSEFLEDQGGSWADILQFIVGNLINYFSQMYPLIISLALSITFAGLNKTGQIRAFASFAISHQRVFMAPILFSCGISFLFLFFQLKHLPEVKKNTELLYKKIKNKSDLYKDLLLSEPTNIQNFTAEITKNRSDIDKEIFELGLPIVRQIAEIRGLDNQGNAKHIHLTRLNEKKEIEQKIFLSNCLIKDGFWQGEGGYILHYQTGRLLKKENINGIRFFSTKYDVNQLFDEYFLMADPAQVNVNVLLENRHLSSAKSELSNRFLFPLLVLMFSLLTLSLCVYFDMTKIYMCFALLLGIFAGYFATNIAMAAILPNKISWLASILSIVLGLIISKRMFSKTI